MRAEFDAIASIAHRNLVSLYELDARRDPWLLVMEPIDGRPLLEDPRDDQRRGHARSTAAPKRPSAQAQRDDSPTHATQTGTRATLANLATAQHRPQRIADARPARPALDAPGLAAIARRFIELCDGLEALHARGVLHLDLKPSNVLLERGTERVVIVDLGLAHQHEDASFTLAGTPAYLSPELLEHASPTAAADRYAIGVMLFEALAKRWPFGGSAPQILAQKRYERAPSLRATIGDGAVAPALDELCAALLERDPAARPSLDHVRRTLRSLVAIAPDSQLVVDPGPPRRPTPDLKTPDGRGLCATLFTSESPHARSASAAAIATQLERDGSLVVHARCDHNARVRYALLDRVARGCVAIERDDALIDAVDALVMRAVEDPPALSRAVIALAALVDRIGRRAPLAFVVSEAHEADVESTSILGQLALRTRAHTRWFFAAHPCLEPLEPLRAALASAPSIRFVERTLPDEPRIDPATTVARRTPLEREVLSLLACARGPLATTALCAALARPRGYRAAVRALQLEGLVVRSAAAQDDEGALSLAYSALARPLLDRPERRWTEARLLRSLSSGADPLALARVLAARGHRSSARREFERVAAARSAEGRFVEARACAREAARLADDRAERSTLEEHAAALDAASGHASAAGDAYGRAAALAIEPERARAMRIRCAEQRLIAGRYREGTALLSDVADECGAPLPTSARSALANAAHRLSRVQGGVDARARLEAGLVYVAGIGMIDPLRAAAAHRENIALAERVGDERALIAALEMQAMFDGAIGAPRAAAAARCIERVSALYEALRTRTRCDVERRSLRAAEHRAKGVSAIQFGRFREGLDEFDRAERIHLPAAPWSWHRTVTEHFRLWALYYCGELRALGDAAPARSWRAQQRADRFAALDFRTQHAICAWLLADDAERAAAQLDEAHAALADESGPMQRRDFVVAKVEVELFRGAATRAHDLVRAKLGATPLADASIPEGMRVDSLALRARAALAALAAGDQRASVKASLALTLAALRAERAPWAGALFEYFSGLAMMAAGQHGIARRALGRAADSFGAASMRAYERCARAALRSIDASAPPDESLEFFASEGARDPRAMRRVFWPGAR